MAIAHDNATESAVSASEASFAISHTGRAEASGGIQGVGAFVTVNANANDCLSVDYAGAPLMRIAEVINTGGETARTWLYFRGVGLSGLGGAQTLTVNRNNNANNMYAVCFTVTAAKDTHIHVPGIVALTTNGGTSTLAEQSVTDGSPGSNSLRYAGVNSGLGTPPAQGANSTQLHTNDFTSRSASVCRETTAGQGSRSVGFSSGTADDVCALHAAVIEIDQLMGRGMM